MAFLGRGAPFGSFPAYFEAAGDVEGKSFRVFGLDADPLLAYAPCPLLFGDGVEDERADPFAAARRVEVEHEDLADAGLGDATAACADYGVVLGCHDPAVPALGRSDLATDSFGRVVLGDHRRDPLWLLDAGVGVAPAGSADSRDALGVMWLGAADDGVRHAIPYVFEGSAELRQASPADQAAGEAEEGFVDVGAALVADEQAAALV